MDIQELCIPGHSCPDAGAPCRGDGLCAFIVLDFSAVIHSIDELETVFDSYSPSLPDRRIREYRLDRMRLILEAIGNPERSFRSYHAAGSKGKGSTCAYLAALLSGYGRKCGLYTSPHLYTVRERFTLSGAFFSDDEYISAYNSLEEMTGALRLPEGYGPERPTVFEMYTAYAYLLFMRAGCTDAVIETGLGGRLDATNTLSPEAVILTPVELEHTDVLGRTISAIAREKSRIIVEGKPVFISAEPEEAERVFIDEAARCMAPVHSLMNEVSCLRSSTEQDGEHVSFILDGREFRLTLRMCTAAQAGNAALAVLTASRLGFLSDEGIRAMERTALPGRFERRRLNGRLIVIDTAHTANSAAASRDAFLTLSSGNPVLVFGAVRGKDIEGLVRTLFPPFRRIIISRPGTYRESDPGAIYALATALFPDKDIRLEEDQDRALDSALAFSSDILITGSFYLAAGMGRLKEADGA